MKNTLSLGLAAAASAGYLLHRLGKRWGASEDEVHRSLVGDDLVPHPMLETTHAITIRAPAAAVWPWLVQMGYDRGWWYTDARWYQWVDKYLWKTKPHVSPSTSSRNCSSSRSATPFLTALLVQPTSPWPPSSASSPWPSSRLPTFS
jgi:hypothetical protein